MTGEIVKVSGPLVVAKNLKGCKMGDVVRVGKLQIIGEIIEITGDLVSIQVYEETAGLKVKDPVISTFEPLSVELGPGLISTIFDGIQRPLEAIVKKTGPFISRGIEVFSLNRKKKWEFVPTAKRGESLSEGDVLGYVQETPLLKHRIMVPHGISGKLDLIKKGEFTVEETIAQIGDHKIMMLSRWPIRKWRPLKEKLKSELPLVTGQRIIDSLFPLTKGGAACVPGPFGAGKTVIQHQLAKWANADVIIFVGCGERGNEMTDVLIEFPELKDPKTGRPLLERTVLIANTSNMPIAAREASIYTGCAIAEYFRDMGYHVALMADSTSRWAEALREMSGRLEEMPGEEGYPAYLGRRVAEFYERSGYGVCLGKEGRKGSLSIIGSVSPPGGDLSEPVVQNTLRVTKVFWGLDYKLAHKRHFPAINWLISFSLYHDNLKKFLTEEIATDFPKIRETTVNILSEEAKLEEIVRLVGIDALSQKEQLILLFAKSIREDFLYQSAFDPIDQYSTLKKQYLILKLVLDFYKRAINSIEKDVLVKEVEGLKVWEEIAKLRRVEEEELAERIEQIREIIDDGIKSLEGAVEHGKD